MQYAQTHSEAWPRCSHEFLIVLEQTTGLSPFPQQRAVIGRQQTVYDLRGGAPYVTTSRADHRTHDVRKQEGSR